MMNIQGCMPFIFVLLWSQAIVTNAQGIWTPKGCRVDLLFIMDESGSIGRDDYETQKEFVANFTRELDISPQASQAGVVKFDSTAHLEISLHEHASKEPLMADILAMSYSGGGTSIHDGLKVARTDGFQEINGDRADAPNIAILMTDGQSSYGSAVTEAQLLRATGASVVAIGIGNNIDEDLLYAIASDDDSVFFIEDFDSLIDNIHMILGKSCEASQNCAGGQLDGWNGSYPMMDDCPKLHNPIIEDSQFITFYCGLNYTVLESRVSEARIQVSFLFDGEEVLEARQTVAFPTDRVALHERHLYGRLGKYISCQVQTFYSDTSSLISPEVVSRSYWAGISYSHEFVDVYENDDSPRTLLVYSTLPIGCAPDGSSCELLLDIVSEQFIAVFQNQDGQIRTCSHIFYDYNWSPSDSIAAGYPLQIAPQRDPMFGAVRTATVAVKAKDFGMKNDPSLPPGLSPYPNPWNSYAPGNITVNVHDSRQGPKTCRSTGDPRITTFDGRLYTAPQIGIFTYVQSSSSRDFEVEVRHFGCSPSSTSCSIACGVAVREGRELKVISKCEPDDQLHIIGCCGEDSFEIEHDDSLKNFMITTPGGARIKVVLLHRGMNVYIDAPARDWGQTYGLCGTYNGNTNDDYIGSDGDLYTNVNDFIETWRQPFPSMFGCPCLPPTPEPPTIAPTPTMVPSTTTAGTPAPTTAGTPAPTTAGTPAPTTAGTPTPTTAATPAPTTTTTKAPTTTAGTPAPTTAGTPAPTTAGTPAPTTAGTPAPTTAGTPAPTTAGTPAPTTAETPAPTTKPSTAVPTTTPFDITTQEVVVTTPSCPQNVKNCTACLVDPCIDKKCPGYYECFCPKENNRCDNQCRREFRCHCWANNNTGPYCCETQDPPNGGPGGPCPNDIVLMRSDDFCHCTENGGSNGNLLNSTQCGLGVLEDPFGDVANPGALIKAFIPGFLKENAGRQRRKRRAILLSESESLTDDIDDEYLPVYIEETYAGDENPPIWGTFNVTEQQAIDHCTHTIQTSDAYSSCTGIVPTVEFDITVLKCVQDIQRTGDFSWAQDKVFEFQDQCMTTIFAESHIADRKNPIADPVFGGQVEAFLDNSCPSDCSGRGVCHNKICTCNPGYVGGSCEMEEGTPPTVTKYLGPDVCDVRDRLCQSTKLQALNLVNSDKLSCRVHVQQINGTGVLYQESAEILTDTSVRCRLPDLKTLDLGNTNEDLAAGFSYKVQLSNDGNQFVGEPFESHRFVVDTLCMDCSSGSSCSQRIDSCMIEGNCHSPGEQKDVCFGCYPENHLKRWTVDPSLPKPALVSGSLYMKVEDEELALDFEAIDPRGKDIVFASATASDDNVHLLSNGTVLWLASTETAPSDLGVQMTAVDDCPRTDTVLVNLVTVSCESICGEGGKCIPDPTKPRGLGYYLCECGDGLTGEHCEHNIDDCLSDPCVHGECVDATNGYTCECDQGYVGTHCDTSEGSLGEWSEFGPCTKECDYGLKTRTRECHGHPCDPAALVHTVMCNEFNCEESDGELNEGTVLLFSNANMQKVVEDEIMTHELTAETLNVHCNDHPRDCCSAVGLGNMDSNINPGRVFLKENVRTAKGYPQFHSENDGTIREKILAEVDRSDFSGFCHVPENERRRKRQTAGTLVDSSFMSEAVSENKHILVQGLGTEVSVEGAEVVEEKRWWIFAAVVGGVLLVVIIVLAVCLGKKGARNRPSTDKKGILNEESHMDALARRPSDVSVNPPANMRLNERAPSDISLRCPDPPVAVLDQRQWQMPRPSLSEDRPSSAGSGHRPPSENSQKRSNLIYPQMDNPLYGARAYHN